MTRLCPQLLLQEAKNLLLDCPSLQEPDRAAQNIPGMNKVTPHHAPSSSRKFLYPAEIKHNFCADLPVWSAKYPKPSPASLLWPHGLNQVRPRCALTSLLEKPDTGKSSSGPCSAEYFPKIAWPTLSTAFVITMAFLFGYSGNETLSSAHMWVLLGAKSPAGKVRVRKENQELWNTNTPREGDTTNFWDILTISTAPENVPTALPALWELWDGTQEQKFICWNLDLCFFPSEWPRSARVSLFMRSWRSPHRHRAQAMCFSSILTRVPARHKAQNKILLIRDDYSKSAALAQPCSRSCAKWLVNKQICSLSAEWGIKIRFNFSTNPGIWHCQNNFLFESKSRLWVRQQKRTGNEI